MAKKRSGSKSAKGALKGGGKVAPPKRGDFSRLDTAPLQAHIRKRIKELEGKKTAAARTGDDTLRRLKEALETLEDICHPSMTIPI